MPTVPSAFWSSHSYPHTHATSQRRQYVHYPLCSPFCAGLLVGNHLRPTAIDLSPCTELSEPGPWKVRIALYCQLTFATPVFLFPADHDPHLSTQLDSLFPALTPAQAVTMFPRSTRRSAPSDLDKRLVSQHPIRLAQPDRETDDSRSTSKGSCALRSTWITWWPLLEG